MFVFLKVFWNLIRN